MARGKKIDNRPTVKVVTDNRFITANGLQNLSLKARKLLYIAISQVRKTDTDFFLFSISPVEFADLMGVAPSHVYQEADKLAEELQPIGIRCDLPDGETTRRYSMFSYIEYGKDKQITFKLNPDMTDFLLELKGNFTQPLLQDFLKMNSPYSMAIWHLMQREMQSKKPGAESIDFYLSLEELRVVTGTETKFKQLVEFKRRVLDKAIREIADNCGVVITYENVKQSRTVIGFSFTASGYFPINDDMISAETKARAAAGLERIRHKRELASV